MWTSWKTNIDSVDILPDLKSDKSIFYSIDVISFSNVPFDCDSDPVAEFKVLKVENDTSWVTLNIWDIKDSGSGSETLRYQTYSSSSLDLDSRAEKHEDPKHCYWESEHLFIRYS